MNEVNLSRKKRILFSAAILLVFVMLSSTALAVGAGTFGPPSGQEQGRNDQSRDAGTGASSGQLDAGAASSQAGNDQQENPPAQYLQSNGNVQTLPEQGKGDVTRDRETLQLQDQQQIDIEAVNAAIAGLMDTEAKVNLDALVEAYKNAIANEKKGIDSRAGEKVMEAYCEAARVAKQALLGALDEAGIPQELCIEERSRDRNETSLNLGSIKTEIATLTDKDLQVRLSPLVTAYETALANEARAMDSGVDEATLAIYRDAVKDAEQALIDALDTQGTGAVDAEVQSPEPQIQTQDDEGFFSGIFQWFLNIFGISA